MSTFELVLMIAAAITTADVPNVSAGINQRTAVSFAVESAARQCQDEFADNAWPEDTWGGDDDYDVNFWLDSDGHPAVGVYKVIHQDGEAVCGDLLFTWHVTNGWKEV